MDTLMQALFAGDVDGAVKAMATTTRLFEISTPVRIAGLIVGDIELCCRATISGATGSVIVRKIEVYGHPDDGLTCKARWAELPPSDPLWARINGYLVRSMGLSQSSVAE